MNLKTIMIQTDSYKTFIALLHVLYYKKEITLSKKFSKNFLFLCFLHLNQNPVC